MNDYILFLISAVFSGFCTWLILKFLIPVLRSKKIGQKISEIGPRWHKSKEGTPIMGGLGFILPAILLFAGFGVYSAISENSFFGEGFLPGAVTFAMAVLCGCIGFFDDYTKLIKKQNEGFKPWQKLVLQLIVATEYIIVMRLYGYVDTAIELPFCDTEIELGFLYYVLCVLLIAGVDNAVNITDGVDGLCASCTTIVALFFATAYFAGIISPVGESGSALCLLSACVAGGCAGFLCWNFYPARIFMGDTGSLYLGGAVVGMSFLAGEPLIVLICGILYILEILSVVLQVIYFKLTHGKRLFKMSPIHHHFERCGWSEIKIVAVFSAVTVIGCVIAWFGLKL